MVAFPTIVGGAHGYTFIFTHGFYQLLERLAYCLQCTDVQQLLTNFIYYLVVRHRWNDLGQAVISF